MNTKLITGTKPKKELNLPKLTADKRNRVVTKHFTNLAMYLERNELSLLNWLVYQSDVNNVFIRLKKALASLQSTNINMAVSEARYLIYSTKD